MITDTQTHQKTKRLWRLTSVKEQTISTIKAIKFVSYFRGLTIHTSSFKSVTTWGEEDTLDAGIQALRPQVM